MVKLSIIIPAYNEAGRIEKTLISYYTFFSKNIKDFEIIIVPNNCSDNTFEIVKKFSHSKKNIKIKNITHYVGKGGAIIEGFKIAKGDYIGFTDADNATNAEAFFELYKNIEDYDGIIASRWIKGAKINRKQPIFRRVASRVFNVFVRILFGIKLRDTQCGAKLFKKEKLMLVLPELVTTRWAFDVDLLYKFKLKNYKVVEIATEWTDDPNSKLNIKKASLEMFFAISRLRLIHSPFRFIVDIYDNLANIFLIINITK